MNETMQPLAARSMEAICPAMMLGLHAVAQPLTILRATLDRDRVEQLDPEPLRQVMGRCSEQVERLCSLLDYLQQMTDAAMIPPRCSAVRIRDLLAFVAEGVSLPMREARLQLTQEISPECDSVWIDRARTEQALSSILLAALRLSAAEDTIELIARPMQERMRIVIRNEALVANHLTAETRLALALAEVDIRSQGGEYRLCLDPFCITAELVLNR